MRKASFTWAALALLCAAILSSCGGGSTATNPNPGTGTVVVTGTDLPVGNVLAFQATVTSLTLNNGSTSVSVISSPQTIEFSQLNGLQTLLDVNSVPTGNYTSATITLSSPVMSVLDTTQTPPVVTTLNSTSTPAATLTQSSVTANIANGPLMVSSTELVGLQIDFHLLQSIQVDATGNFTGMVNPTISLAALTPGAKVVTVDEFRGGVVTVNTSAGSFVMQGVGGLQFTVQTTSSTAFSPNDSLSTLTNNDIVVVSGALDKSNLSINADEVDVASQNRFGIVGIITSVTPSVTPCTFPGTGAQVSLLVRNFVPDSISGIQIGQLFTVNLTGNEDFFVRRHQMLTGNFAFNGCTLIPGQQLTVGGTLDTSVTPPTLTPVRVMDDEEGFFGFSVVASVNATDGTFQFTPDDVAGVLLAPNGGAATVKTGTFTKFVGTSLGDIANSATPVKVRIIGLVLLDQSANQPRIFARAVEAM